MPTPGFITVPDFDSVEQKYGCLEDASNIKYPLVRHQDERVTGLLASVSGSYEQDMMIGSPITFSSISANNGWAGKIKGVSLNIGDTDFGVGSGTPVYLGLLLFGGPISATASSVNEIQYVSLPLTQNEADSYIGRIVLDDALATSDKTFFSKSNLELQYFTQSNSNLLSAIIYVHTSSELRTLSSSRIFVGLDVSKS